MCKKSCKCDEKDSTGRMLKEYLRSLYDCITNGEELLDKDHQDIEDLLVKADKVFN